MKTIKISVPKFCNAIYNKVHSYLTSLGVGKERFFSFCYAVYLATKNQLSSTIPSLTLSERDNEDLNSLYDLGLYVRQSEDGKILLFGLAPGNINDDWLEGIELLVNYFFIYNVRFKSKYKLLEDEFMQVCLRLEDLRSTYQVPARFFYNKFIRRDNGNFSGGLTITVSVVPPDTDLPSESADSHSDHDEASDAYDQDDSIRCRKKSP